MKFKKTLAVLMSILMLFSIAPMAMAADGADVDYKIDNPYANVDFENDNVYKADLHSHTTFSDGNNTLPEMTERHYELGFDIYAVTDHSSCFYSFTEPQHVDVMKLFSLVKNGFVASDALSESGTAANGNAYTVTTSESGDQYYAQAGGKQMMGVPFGNEQNGTSFNNAHINTWFVDYGHGRLGGTSYYEDVIKAVDELGGLSVINHPGEYTNARDEIFTADAYNKDDIMYNYKIRKFEHLLINYDSCIGIDINSKGDSRTRFDRKLWDIMLQDLLPISRNVFAIATTDAHNLHIVDSGYTMHYMPELTSANLKKNMQEGGFFAASKYVGNHDELATLRDELKAIGTADALAFYEILDPLVNSSAEDMANGGEGNKYEAPEGEARPLFTNVVVNEKEDTITLEAENALVVHWIADGKVIHVGNTIDLDDYSDEIRNYVRAEAYGKGGVMYTQPFALDYNGVPRGGDFGDYFDWGVIASAICDNLVRALAFILPVNLIVNIFG
ncbi:MAG: hypothetical protein IJF20_05110 [Clostridia bacterium]|nr:hypothetical protein [Clostridia bacterium]